MPEMSQTTATRPVCSDCGSEALGPALFCYHCGARLSVEESQDAADQTQVTGTKSDDSVDVPIGPPPGDPFEDAGAEGDREDPPAKITVSEKAKTDVDPGMTTATALRKNPELLRMRRVEVRWTPNEGSPNVWFILAALALSIIVLGIFLLSMFLR